MFFIAYILSLSVIFICGSSALLLQNFIAENPKSSRKFKKDDEKEYRVKEEIKLPKLLDAREVTSAGGSICLNDSTRTKCVHAARFTVLTIIWLNIDAGTMYREK